jgi:hypothetical protein
MTRSLREHPKAFAGRRFRNTGGLSGELSVGDVVTVVADGEVWLAVAKAGWTPVTGPLNEVRTSEHGTRPLPLPRSPGEMGQLVRQPHFGL